MLVYSSECRVGDCLNQLLCEGRRKILIYSRRATWRVRFQRGCLRWERTGGRPLGVRHDYVLFEGGTVALCHRSIRGRRKNPEKLAIKTGRRGRSFAEQQNRSRCPLFCLAFPRPLEGSSRRLCLCTSTEESQEEESAWGWRCHLGTGLAFGICREPRTRRVDTVCPAYHVAQGEYSVDDFRAEWRALF